MHTFRAVLKSRFYALSLLFLFLINVLGGISFLLIQQHQRHEYVESMIKSESYGHRLTQIHIAANESTNIKWVEKNREFRYKGDMYDVVWSELTANGGTIFHCIADHEETKLYAEIERTLCNDPIGQHNDLVVVLQLFKFFSDFLNTALPMNDGMLITIQKCKTIYIGSLLQVTITFPAEPPELA